MRKLYAWLGAATLFMLVSQAGMVSRADAANDVLKPYVVLILDTSGSMLIPTQSGPTSCGKTDTRLNHAVCAINNIVNSYGDMVFSLSRFRETTATTTGTQGSLVCDTNGDQDGNVSNSTPIPGGGDNCNTEGATCGDCDPSTGAPKTCTANNQCASNNCSGGFCVGIFGCSNFDRNFEVLTPLVDGNNALAAEFTNGSCNTCNTAQAGTLDPEIWGVGNTFTPLSGTLRGAKDYWEGRQATESGGATIWPNSLDGITPNAGFDPINRDPAAAVFLTANDQANCNATAGCTPFNPEVACTGTADDDSDGRANDGCPTVGDDPETDCTGTGTAADNDGDGVANDGCPAWCSGTSCCCASQCRPYITILLTDGEETCTSFANTVQSTTELLDSSPDPDAMPIQSITRVGNVVTLNTSSTGLQHHFKVGDQILVLAVTGFSGTFIVTGVPTTRSLTYTMAGTATTINNTGTVRHTASNNQYRIETKPIGFGIAPGDPSIEAIAHAGGAADVPGVNEGFYAADEADLELAISQILADSVRSELCNARDDDCDVRIDEDFPNKNGACTNGQQGICLRNGNFVCRADGTGLQCNAPTIGAGTEGPGCNQLDDDCDGRIDEGLSCQSCVPTGEVCDGDDDDCDGVPDQTCRCNGASTNAGALCDNVGTDCLGGGAAGCLCTSITRACGTGTCVGTETCVGGVFDGCDAPDSDPETCDGEDNDCDGLCDGFQLECSEQNEVCDQTNTSCPAVDSLGHPSRSPIPENICRPGVRTCPLDNACSGSNTFGICSGEVLACGADIEPEDELPNAMPPVLGCDVCNGLDDDCDNEIDENFRPADCSTNCGVGETICTNGVISCDSMAATDDPTCDNIDDDCDLKFDEDWECPDVAPDDGVCDECGVGLVCMGMPKCVMGLVECQGDPIGTETCNCLDDNCNNMVDEGTICPGGSSCVNCQCAFPCAGGEFPCPLGKKCEMSTAGNFCVNDPCFNVTCPAVNGNLQTCIPKPGFANEPQCVDTCTLVNDSDATNYPPCPTSFVCLGSAGECRPNNCTTFPDMCTDTQNCVNGTCVSNPCTGVTCETGQYCVGGACVSSCADIDCPMGQRCRLGACETDPCGEQCPFGQACNDSTGQCIGDPCKVRQCPSGQWCNPNDGQCEDDPCVASGVTCPNEGEECRGGTCIDPDDFAVDAAGESHVTVGGGGGCSTTGGGSGLLFALGLLAVRRRRRTVRAVGGAK